MRKKMEKEMRNSQEIDDAFKAIKTATSVTDVQEMVRRFLTRGSTYSQLLMTVNGSEVKITTLKKDNEMLSGKLHELQIDSQGDDNKDKNQGDSEIIRLNEELGDYLKQKQQMNERFKRINIVNDQVSNWAKRVY